MGAGVGRFAKAALDGAAAAVAHLATRDAERRAVERREGDTGLAATGDAPLALTLARAAGDGAAAAVVDLATGGALVLAREGGAGDAFALFAELAHGAAALDDALAAVVDLAAEGHVVAGQRHAVLADAIAADLVLATRAAVEAVAAAIVDFAARQAHRLAGGARLARDADAIVAAQAVTARAAGDGAATAVVDLAATHLGRAGGEAAVVGQAAVANGDRNRRGVAVERRGGGVAVARATGTEEGGERDEERQLAELHECHLPEGPRSTGRAALGPTAFTRKTKVVSPSPQNPRRGRVVEAGSDEPGQGATEV